jgi:hypothetical protein
MNHPSRLLVAASMGLALATGAAVAQQAPAASAPMGASSMQDCKAMHGQGSDKPMPMDKSGKAMGMPMDKPMKCAMGSDGGASAPAKRGKSKPAHEHSKVHKNQG